MIQSLISQAANLPRGGVVHLPSGEFKINSTILIPKGGPVQIIGDGPLATSLVGTDNLETPILRSESLQIRVAELAIRQDTVREQRPPTRRGFLARCE